MIIPAVTIVINPAAGPDTPTLAPLKKPTTIPPITPAIIPENRCSEPAEAKAIPKHKGNATRYTTKLAGISSLQFEKKLLIIVKINS